MRNLFVGDNIKLTAVKETDIEAMEEWFNDVEFMRHYDMVPAVPHKYKDVEQMIDSFSNTSERYVFSIRLIEKEEFVGIIGFDDIIWSNGVATVFIGIGNKSHTGKGLGKEAMQLLLDFGFNELNFHRIQLNVLSYNTNAIKLYESVGFHKEGTFREFICRDGKRWDMYLYGLLSYEWKKS
jgi:Acetyltransferases, including N-acetylases of ribosomal proteins